MSTAVLTTLLLLAPAQVPPPPPQPPVQDPQQPASPWAAKVFRDAAGNVPPGHDFGTVPKGAQLQHRFPMNNLYAVPLQIITRVSCDCVTVTPSPQTLQPRETGTLDISMDTRRFNGSKQVTVHVSVVSPNLPGQQQFASTASFLISANCRGDVSLNPGQAQFGVVPGGQPAERVVDVTYAGIPNWQTWRLTATPVNDAAPFDVQFQEVNRRAGQVTYRVALKLKAGTPPGSYKGDLQIQSNDPNNQLVPVPYDATVQAPLTASPETTSFGVVGVGQEVTRNLVVRANKPFKVLRIDGKPDGLTADGRAMSPQVYLVTLHYKPTTAGPLNSALTIVTDLDGGATVSARVTATAQ